MENVVPAWSLFTLHRSTHLKQTAGFWKLQWTQGLEHTAALPQAPVATAQLRRPVLGKCREGASDVPPGLLACLRTSGGGRAGNNFLRRLFRETMCPRGNESNNDGYHLLNTCYLLSDEPSDLHIYC